LDRLMSRFEKQSGKKAWAVSAVTGKNIDALLLEIERQIMPAQELTT